MNEELNLEEPRERIGLTHGHEYAVHVQSEKPDHMLKVRDRSMIRTLASHLAKIGREMNIYLVGNTVHNFLFEGRLSKNIDLVASVYATNLKREEELQAKFLEELDECVRTGKPFKIPPYSKSHAKNYGLIKDGLDFVVQNQNQNIIKLRIDLGDENSIDISPDRSSKEINDGKTRGYYILSPVQRFLGLRRSDIFLDVVPNKESCRHIS